MSDLRIKITIEVEGPSHRDEATMSSQWSEHEALSLVEFTAHAAMSVVSQLGDIVKHVVEVELDTPEQEGPVH